MRIKAKGADIEKYLQEELLALLPLYRDGAGETVVFTLQGRHQDPRGVPWLVEKLASYYSLNLLELRRRCGDLLGLRHHISLPLSERLVLLPVKVRQSAVLGETTTGFINLLQVKEILPLPVKPSSGQLSTARLHPGHPSGQPCSGRHPSPSGKENPVWLSQVLFKCNLKIKTLNTPETLRDRLRQGDAVLKDFLRRRSQGRGTAFTGLSRQALLEQLPNCDCVLKDIFIELFGLKD